MKKYLVLYWLACFLVSAALLNAAYAQTDAAISAGRGGSYTAEHVFGYNADIASAAEETIWDQGGLYSYITAASPVTVSSSSANDTSAGTGARTVRVFGVNSAGAFATEDFTLTGTTKVTGTTSWWRVLKMEVLTAGSGAINAGDIYAGDGVVTAGVPATKYAKILAGNGRTLMAMWHTSSNRRALLKNLTIVTQDTATANTLTIRLVARITGGVFQTYKKFVATYTGGPITIPNPVPLYFPPNTDIEVRAQSSGAARDVAADATFIVVN